MFNKINSWRKYYLLRKKYSTGKREPFFEIAAKYLPKHQQANILDIGAGEGDFANYCINKMPYENFYLLEGNPKTVELLNETYDNVIHYRIPGRLPFEDLSVDFVHCSHIFEHLLPNDLYQVLRDIDRVLKDNGVFIISGPLMWRNFYFDMSHLRPYFPETFKRYLCSKSNNYSSCKISSSFIEKELVYRYDASINYHEGFGSEYSLLDFAIQITKKIFYLAKIKNYRKNGFTLVLQKQCSINEI